MTGVQTCALPILFIMDDAEQFMPNYLRFVRGLIDSSDLPLNVSREILQDSTVTRNLRNALTKRVLQMLEKLAKDDAEKYQTFWQQFGLVLKEGPAEDFANQEAIAKLLRFASTFMEPVFGNVSYQEILCRIDPVVIRLLIRFSGLGVKLAEFLCSIYRIIRYYSA